MTDEIPLHAIARDSAQEREEARHDLTVVMASALFAEFGVPRSPRSVQGFCKDGHIDCIRAKGPNGDRYFVNRQSVERYATELKQIEEVGKISAESAEEVFAQEREPARDSARQRAEVITEQAISHVDDGAHAEELEVALTTLREENLNLQIDNRAKEQFINQLVKDRNSIMQSVQDVNYRLGAAEVRVQQLEAPREPARDSAQDRADERNIRNAVTVDVIEPVEAEIETAVDAAPPPVPVDPPKHSLFQKIFGG